MAKTPTETQSDDPKTVLSIYLEPDLKRRIKTFCASSNVTITEYVTGLVQADMATKKAVA